MTDPLLRKAKSQADIASTGLAGLLARSSTNARSPEVLAEELVSVMVAVKLTLISLDHVLDYLDTDSR